ncbi:solute carrier family 23 protein, partial [Staphylococcus epidermidis]
MALPVVLGCAVEYVGPLAAIGTNSQLGIDVMYGSIIGAGIFILLVSGLFARLRWLFPPVVTGSLITLIGFTLIPV